MANEFKVKKGLIVEGSGSAVLDIQGSQGQLFSITDDLTGDLFSVSDISGVPILNVNADGTSTFDGNVILTGPETLDSTSDTSIKFLTRDSNGVVKYHTLGSNAFNSNTYNNYSLPLGSSSTRGGFKIGYTESGKNYPVEISSEKMYVNVPWTDNNTQLSQADVRKMFSGNAINTSTGVITDTNTFRSIHDTPVNGATTTSISSNWAFDNVKKAVPSNALFTDTNTQLTTAQVRGKFSAGTNVQISSTGVISSTDTNTDTNTQLSDSDIEKMGYIKTYTDTNTQLTTAQVRGKFSGNGINTSTGVITDTNTQLSAAEVRGKFSAGTNVQISAAGVISSTDTNTDTNTQLTTAQVRGKFSGNGINTSTGVITDTNTQLSAADVRKSFSAGTNVQISAAGVISSTDTNTDTNTQLTTAQVRGKISGTGLIGYDSSTGVISTTATNVTNNNQLTNGAGYQNADDVDKAIQTVVDAAPAALDTLNELAASLNDDSDFAGTMTTALAGKLSTSGKAADSNLLDGLDLHTGRNNLANRVVRTNGSGYADFGWINTTSGATSNTLTRVYCSDDGYIRYMTPANFRKQIVSAGTNVQISSTGVISATDTNTDTNTQRTDAEIKDVIEKNVNPVVSATVSNDTTTFTKQDGTTFALTTSDANTWRGIHDTPVNGATTTSISSNWAFDNVKKAVPSNAVFTDTNTQLSAADVRKSFSAGTNVQISAAGVISSTDTNTDTNTQLTTAQVRGKFSGNGINTSTGVITDTNTQLSSAEVRGKFSAGTNVQISSTGVISSTDTNTDTNTQLSDADIAKMGYIKTDTNTQLTTAQVRGKFSGNAINTSTGVITDTNTQLTSAQVRGKFSAGTNVQISSTGVISATDTNTNTQLSDSDISKLGYIKSADGGNANKLDNLDSTAFLRSNADDSFSGGLVSTARDEGIFGTYDSYKTDHIWSMGTSYKNHSAGTNFGNLYGLAYKHTNNTTGGTMAGGHQMVWCENGTGTSAMGTNIWTSGTVSALGGSSSNWNTAYGWGNHASAGYSKTDTNTQLTTAQVRGKFSGNGINTSTGVITNTNTQLSAAQVRANFSAGTNVQISSTGVISATDTNTDTNTQLSDADIGKMGYIKTYTDTNTTYSADGNYGITLSGTTFRLENDRRRNSSTTDIYTGNTHDFTWYDASVGIRWYTAGSEDMRLLDNGTLHVDGDIVAYSSTISDKRLKDNVTTIENPLDKIKALRGVEYDWNNGSKKGMHDLGLIAQEVEEVIPEIISEHTLPFVEGDDDTLYKTVDYEKMVAVLIEGMKEQQTQIDSLKTEIEILKGTK